MPPAASKRIQRVLRLVDELELDRDERRALRQELDAREECQIDLDACQTDEERALAVTLKQRIDAAARGEVELVPIAELVKRGRDEVRRLEAARRPAPARRRSSTG